MGQLIAIYWIIFLLGIVIFVIDVNAHLNELTTTVVDENGIEIQLKWVKTKQFLANKHLPVWKTMLRNGMTLDTNVMKRIGDFETYHDLDKSSAVVYFKGENCLYGVIDTRYHILCLPLDELGQKHFIGKSESVLRLKNNKLFPHHKEEVESGHTSTINRPSTSHGSSQLPQKKRPFADKEYPADHSVVEGTGEDAHLPLKKRQRVYENSDDKPTFYPEILLFVSHDLVKEHEEEFGENYLDDIVLHNIVFMNAVAMLFAKLSNDVNIHINIAGIVVEQTTDAFRFAVSQYINAERVRPTGEEALDSMKQYIKNVMDEAGKGHVFFIDDFDFFLLTTTFRSALLQEDKPHYRGISTEWFNIYHRRCSSKLMKDNMECLGSIVDHSNVFQSYIDATREIAHLMQINDDPPNSHSIMQNDGLHLDCLDCLKWSRESIQSAKEFFSQNKNRCYLLNEPRSLNEYGVPTETLTPESQCECYALKLNTQDEKYQLDQNRSKDVCRTVIPCDAYASEGNKFNEKSRTSRKRLPFPIDGTPCGEKMVCSRWKCVPGVMKLKSAKGT